MQQFDGDRGHVRTARAGETMAAVRLMQVVLAMPNCLQQRVNNARHLC